MLKFGLPLFFMKGCLYVCRWLGLVRLSYPLSHKRCTIIKQTPICQKRTKLNH